MNLEVPCLAACKRLAKAGIPQCGESWVWTWYWSRDSETGEWEFAMLAMQGKDEFAAPTIGEMLAYIRRGPYEFRKRVASALVSRPEWSLNGGEERVDDCVLNFLCLVDADALANALAESFEKEGKT